MPRGYYKNAKPRKCIVCGCEFKPRNNTQKKCEKHIKRPNPKNRCILCGRHLDYRRGHIQEGERVLCSFCREHERQLEHQKREAMGRYYGYCKMCGDKKPKEKLREGLCELCFELKEKLARLKENPELTRQCYEEVSKGYERPSRGN